MFGFLKVVSGSGASTDQDVLHGAGAQTVEDILAEIRARRGMEELDRREGQGRWEHRIWLPSLDIGCSTTCALGQVYGDYAAALRRWPMETEQAIAQGFYWDDLVDEQQLTRAWKRLLKERRRQRRQELSFFVRVLQLLPL